MTYHAARINYRSSQILDSNTMQHRGPQLKEKKNHTHVTHTAATWTAAAHNAAAGAKQRAALDPGVNTVVGSVSSSCRCGLAAFTGDRFTDSDDGGVER